VSQDVSASLPSKKRPGEDRSRVSKQTRVVSASKSVPARVAEIWQCRELLVNLVSTEIKIKYKNSTLGLLWSMVSPAANLAIYWLVFGVILRNGVPNFVIYLFSGTLFWNFFQTGVQTATGVVVQQAGIVKKVAFPREILALAAVGTAAVYMFFQAIVLVLFMVIVGNSPAWGLLPLLIPALIAVALISVALGVALSAVNVYLRDMQHLIEVIMMAWFWACPIVYSFWTQIHPKLSHHGLTWIYLLNPMTPIILTSQRVIYNQHLYSYQGHLAHVLPPWPATTFLLMDLALIVVGLFATYGALAIFGRLEGNFAEEL
jgi:ABC-2 type transport system permease protein